MLIFISILFLFWIIIYVWNIISFQFNTDKWGVYKDGNGLKRLKRNKHLVEYKFKNNGYYILEDLFNGKTIVNITNEISKLSKQRSIKNNRTVYMIMPGNCRGSYKPKIINPMLSGCRYRDVLTDEPYVIRYVEYYTEQIPDLKQIIPLECRKIHYKFYMNMNNYKFVRIADEEIKKCKNKDELNSLLNISNYIIDKRNKFIEHNKSKVDVFNSEILLNEYCCVGGEFDDEKYFLQMETN